MKRNLFYLLAVVLIMPACNNSPQYEPAAPVSKDAQSVWFTVNDERGSEISPKAGITSHEVTLEREDAEKELTVGLQATVNTDNVFNVPASVTFKAGEKQAVLSIGFSKMEVGYTYSLAINLDMSAINPYVDKYDATDNLLLPVYFYSVTPIEYSDLKQGVWVDYIIPPYLASYGVNVPVTTYYVNYQTAEMPDGTIKLRAINPYFAVPTGDADADGIYPEYPMNEEADLLEGAAYNFVMTIYEDGSVELPDTYLGINYGGGATYVVMSQEYGEYDEEAQSIIFSYENEALISLDDYGMDYAMPAGFELYLSKDAFLAAYPDNGNAGGEDEEGDEEGEGEGDGDEEGEGEGEGEGTNAPRRLNGNKTFHLKTK
ncbi:MAG: hypothetical protein IJ169_05430 [Paludibacteraceae bacterium]|nr:hypothetical protein [Paludibacteraceae bacterium]